MSDSRKPIEAPKPHRTADVGRAALKGALGAIPGVGALASEAAGLLAPDPSTTERRRWEGEITGGVNDLHGRVDELGELAGKRTATLSEQASRAARFMAESCPDGLSRKWIMAEDLTAACPDLDRKAVRDAMGELESYGLVKPLSAIGGEDRYRITHEGYIALDPAVMGWSPSVDARAVAGAAARHENGVNVAALDAELGWPRRRFNPALRIVTEMIGSGRVSQTNQPDYVTRHFSPNAAERAILRRFAAGG